MNHGSPAANSKLKLTTVKSRGGGAEFGRANFTGLRQPPLPARPDLSKVKFGEPIKLFNGEIRFAWLGRT